jgi:hypothetical protein
MIVKKLLTKPYFSTTRAGKSPTERRLELFSLQKVGN